MVTAGDSDIILNGTSVYVKAGETFGFEQDYSLHVKYVNPESERIWISLSLNDESVADSILGRGEIFTYSSNSSTVFNITMGKIYYGSSGELVTFDPVYQYVDQRYPYNPEDEEMQNKMPNSSENESKNQGVPFLNPALLVLFAFLLPYVYENR
ncbi:S-layer protein domain-containing protein [Methanohalophilus profundi]|uniref:S-layer protein domain-containing protein n=1 Tax=Methanohalophilus profundi TaxID=2138083 RepID=UPI0013EA3258|nr:S-layer protein domain-containing protein [Methanohalophilus profundi]